MRFNAVIAGVGMTPFGKHIDTGLKALGAEAVQRRARRRRHRAGRPRGRLRRQRRGRPGHRPGVHPRPGDPALDRARADPGRQRRERLRERLDGAEPGLRDGDRRALRRGARPRRREALPRGQEEVLRRLQRRGGRRGDAGDHGGPAARTPRRAARSPPPRAPARSARCSWTSTPPWRAAHMQKYGTTVEQFAGGLGEELLPRQHEPARPVPRGADGRGGAGRADDRRAADAPDVLAHRRRRRRRDRGERAKARELGIAEARARGLRACCTRAGTTGSTSREPSSSARARPTRRPASGREDLDVVECHDASAPAEITAYESLGLCPKGEGGKLIDEGATRLGGRLPVNTSGGLLRKGHPVGATGIAQIVELTEQLQGRSGKRQVEGAKVALAHNGGGTIGTDAAAMCVTILQTVGGRAMRERSELILADLIADPRRAGAGPRRADLRAPEPRRRRDAGRGAHLRGPPDQRATASRPRSCAAAWQRGDRFAPDDAQPPRVRGDDDRGRRSPATVFVPIDPRTRGEKLAYMLRNSGCRGRHLRRLLPRRRSPRCGSRPRARVDPGARDRRGPRARSRSERARRRLPARGALEAGGDGRRAPRERERPAADHLHLGNDRRPQGRGLPEHPLRRLPHARRDLSATSRTTAPTRGSRSPTATPRP